MIRIALFELRYHLTRVSTYVSFALVAVVNLLLVSFEYVNSPVSLSDLTADVTTFGLIVVSAICGMAVCRDFEERTYQIFFATPMTRRDYLAGRLAGSLLVVTLVFIAMPLGQMLGTVVPWHHDDILPFRAWHFLQPFLLIALPAIWFSGVLFFAAGALSRRVGAVYLQGVVLLSLYLIGEQILQGDSIPLWPAILDPMGQTAIARVTDGWSVIDLRTRTVPFAGVMAANRLVWIAVGLAAAAVVMRFFPRSIEAMATRPRRARAEGRQGTREIPAAAWRAVPVPAFDWRTTTNQWWTLTRLRAITILTDPIFLAIVVLSVTVLMAIGWERAAVRVGALVSAVPFLRATDAGVLIATIATAMYAGELVWRERAIGHDQIHDATPVATPVDILSRLTALVCVQMVVLGTSVLSGVALSLWQGHSLLSLRFYVADVVLVQSWTLVLYAVGAMFVHSVMPNRFMGHVIVVGAVVATPLMNMSLRVLNVTVPMNLYDFGAVDVRQWAGLNGYGPGRAPAAWFWTYWASWAGLLLTITLLVARRGRERGWRARTRQARLRWAPRYAVAVVVFGIAWIGVGGRIYARAQPHRPQPGTTLRDMLPDGTPAIYLEPPTWNGSVIIDAFGVSSGGIQPDALRALLLERGFAVAAPMLPPGYWALGDKQERLDALRSDIARRYGAAAPVYVFGHSEGGYRTLAALEQHPDQYRGGVAFCAFTPVEFELPEPALDLLVAFDYLYPELLTTRDTTLATVAPMSVELYEKMHRAIGSDAAKARDLAARFDLDPQDLELAVTFFATIVREFQDMALGNPFDVTTRPFARMADVPGFMENVRRFAADAAALQRTRSRLSPLTGRLGRPALIVENAYDPILPPHNVGPYAARVASSGSTENLVIADVAGRAHCDLTVAEEIAAIEQMVAWADGGAKPGAGRLTAKDVAVPAFPQLPPSHLDGHWRLTDVVNNGRFSPPLSPAAVRRVWSIANGRISSMLDGRQDTPPAGLSVTNAGASPNHSDEYDLIGERWQMIHEVRGDQFIQAYFLDPSRAFVERPRSFVQPGLQVRVFKRVEAAR